MAACKEYYYIMKEWFIFAAVKSEIPDFSNRPQFFEPTDNSNQNRSLPTAEHYNFTLNFSARTI